MKNIVFKITFHQINYVKFVLLITMTLTNMTMIKAQKRLRDHGITIGVLNTGEKNAITDVTNIRVGHHTLVEGHHVRTGVTAILPHSDNIYQNKVPAAIYIGNGFGKLAGYSQVEELGNIETPIVLTNTLSVAQATNGLIRYTLQAKGNEEVRSVNSIVGETNDGWLNDIRGQHVTEDHVLSAINNAHSGKVEEGNIGAGTGTICFGFKGGIGTSSRKLPESLGGYTVGVLVQTNFGGVLEINGVPIGEKLGHIPFKEHLNEADGSCMIVVATDAPVNTRNLKRIAKRAMLGLAKTGGIASNGSGDYVIALSTYESNFIKSDQSDVVNHTYLKNERMTPLFMATIEATEEAILNSLFTAQTTKGRDGHVINALPVDKVLEIMKEHQSVK